VRVNQQEWRLSPMQPYKRNIQSQTRSARRADEVGIGKSFKEI
jgi:hypothetical protein